ncbi:proline iminopeptidase [Silvibacterium bohemicum]|uniref:Proline iminopeptidase n=1 Tax=Silvibacterium bohemicum TaxID=1577686 RepID=A0A841JQB4_9BACT|nr:alpha/beta hydrolase [Silvibacterium bohemicum]MBB6142747.1 proline iminopeptidase [Silvibacterium bohemicum]
MPRFGHALVVSYLVLCLLWGGSVCAQSSKASLAAYADQFQTGKISRDGFDLYFRSAGAGEPVLILSGGPGDDCDYMLPVAAAVAKHQKAILVEQRGTGRSLPPHVDATTMNVALSLADYEALRMYLKADRWTVIGHSAGGLLAIRYAIAQPEHVSQLVLLDSAPVSFSALAAFDDNILDRLQMGDRTKLEALESQSGNGARADAAELQSQALFFNRELGSQMGKELSSAWHSDVGHLLGREITPPNYDLRPQLGKYQGRVLVLSGRQDPMDPVAAYETKLAFQHAAVRFIDRAGHFPWFEQPAAFNQALDDFFTSK